MNQCRAKDLKNRCQMTNKKPSGFMGVLKEWLVQIPPHICNSLISVRWSVYICNSQNKSFQIREYYSKRLLIPYILPNLSFPTIHFCPPLICSWSDNQSMGASGLSLKLFLPYELSGSCPTAGTGDSPVLTTHAPVTIWAQEERDPYSFWSRVQ